MIHIIHVGATVVDDYYTSLLSEFKLIVFMSTHDFHDQKFVI